MSIFTKDEVKFLSDLVVSEIHRTASINDVDENVIKRLQARNAKVLSNLEAQSLTDWNIEFLKSLVHSENERMTLYHDKIESKTFDKLRKRNLELVSKLKPSS